MFLYSEIQRFDAIALGWFEETKIFKGEEVAYAHLSSRRDELKKAGYECANAPYRNCYIHKGNNFCIIPRVEPITVQ